MDTDLETVIQESPAIRQWEKIGIRHHHGLAVPLFNLHSTNSCGIGEYLDLLPLINWCADIGLDTIQLLPLNDTGLGTSPYSALSAFALNPIHISLHALPYLENYPHLREELALMSTPSHVNRINYPHVRETKDRFLTAYYKLVKSFTQESSDYHKFIEASPWLKQYALFKTLKSHHQWLSWEEWPIEFQSPEPSLIEALMHEHKMEIDRHCFIQFLCANQLHQVHEYATEKKIFLMGDIPILINRDSADVWLNRDFFHMDYSAGAPPDAFCPAGQEWGFPIYNWTSLSETGYQWWIDRLKVANLYYHIYRIDHIVGFFRIWAIPLGKKSSDGFFIPSDPSTWIEHGNTIMRMMLGHCDMLPIGEDLGDVPPNVKADLHTLGICGTKVMRWERNWDIDKSFIPLDMYPPLSMTTVSTHDSETLQLWWQNNPQEAKDFAEFKGWCYHPVLSREYRHEILWDSHHSTSLFTVNLLPEYLSLVPGLSWDRLEDERINTPGTFSDENWSCRCKVSVEEIVENTTLAHLMKELII
jgi:4-alpha-glucanotransferase